MAYVMLNSCDFCKRELFASSEQAAKLASDTGTRNPSSHSATLTDVVKAMHPFVGDFRPDSVVTCTVCGELRFAARLAPLVASSTTTNAH